uniref:Dynein light chain roadblock-type 2 n=1 Tax=Caligus clemensi TaxID=344056 RepID=C1C077_CALCM|nr:Dynein light chain roadblock-type 2 [Caligus clemensi]ACO15602.1 Dynein light chain roadblock-type 2 [Caligus clemensi]
MLVEEMEEKFNRIVSHSRNEDVLGGFILDEEGSIIKSSLDNKLSETYADFLSELVSSARKLFRNIDDDVSFVRYSTKKFNVMIALDKNFLFVVLTNSYLASSGVN